MCGATGVAVGLLDSLVLHQGLWLSAPLAVSLSVIGMLVTKCLHPPGGGTALIALMGPASIQVSLMVAQSLRPTAVGVVPSWLFCGGSPVGAVGPRACAIMGVKLLAHSHGDPGLGVGVLCVGWCAELGVDVCRGSLRHDVRLDGGNIGAGVPHAWRPVPQDVVVVVLLVHTIHWIPTPS